MSSDTGGNTPVPPVWRYIWNIRVIFILIILQGYLHYSQLRPAGSNDFSKLYRDYEAWTRKELQAPTPENWHYFRNIPKTVDLPPPFAAYNPQIFSARYGDIIDKEIEFNPEIGDGASYFFMRYPFNIDWDREYKDLTQMDTKELKEWKKRMMATSSTDSGSLDQKNNEQSLEQGPTTLYSV